MYTFQISFYKLQNERILELDYRAIADYSKMTPLVVHSFDGQMVIKMAALSSFFRLHGHLSHRWTQRSKSTLLRVRRLRR